MLIRPAGVPGQRTGGGNGWGGDVQVSNANTSAEVLDARPLADQSGGMALHTDGVNDSVFSDGFWQAYFRGGSVSFSFAAIAADAISLDSPLYGYSNSRGIVAATGLASYGNLWSAAAPTLTKLSAIPHFLVGPSASSWTSFNTDTRATTTIALPVAGTPTVL